MGKRSNFERKERDFYPTPYEAVLPLMPHWVGITPGVITFVEPCAGDFSLVEHIMIASRRNISARCFDIEPRHKNVKQKDALTLVEEDLVVFDTYVDRYDYIVTNPPWDRKILHPMIDHFRSLRPTWLLFDADWMHTKQASPYLEYCSKIVSVGRVKWIPDSKMTGKDNCAWYLFEDKKQETKFYGRERD